MKKQLKSYSLFFISLVFMSLGITFITKSNLGASPITSIPFVLSLAFRPSFGLFTFISNLIFFLLQILILRRDFPRVQYLQLLIGPILGVFIDIWMAIFSFLNPIDFPFQLASSVLGCFIIASSITLQLRSGVVVNPAGGIVRTIAFKVKREFGKTKIVFDLFLVLIASILSIIFMGKINGIGLGTFITAVLVGALVRWINKTINRFTKDPLKARDQ